MTPRAGCRFAVAPRFQVRADWEKRLAVGRPWSPPPADELAVLAPTSPSGFEECVCLFQLPRHLRSLWWTLLERSAGTLEGGRLPGFDSFVAEVAEFLAFKNLPLPGDVRCDVVVSDPGQRPADESPGSPSLWGVINLGDEPTTVVLGDHAPVRVVLGPGEGVRLPERGLILRADAEGGRNADVVLMMSREANLT